MIKTLRELVDTFKNRIGTCFAGNINTAYREVHCQVLQLCRGLLESGLCPGDRVMLLSGNRPEWLITTLALNYCGMIDVPRGEKASDGELNYIIKHSEPKMIIVENEKLYERVKEARKRVKIISIEKINDLQCLEDMKEKGRKSKRNIPGVEPDTVASHLYTSGTTGEPKGAVLTHWNYISNTIWAEKRLDLHEGDIAISILPLWHVFERLAEYAFLINGMSIFYSSILTFSNDLITVKPTVMAVVPRILEMIYDKKIMKKLGEKSKAQQYLFKLMVNLSAQTRDKGFNPLKFLGMLPVKYMEKEVFSKLKEGFGGRMRILVSGGGKLRYDIDYFFHAAGMPILEGYGLTETSPVIALRSPENRVLGTVGKPLENLQIKIVDSETGKTLRQGKRGVIFVKGSSVMQGYYKNAYETSKVMKDGWFDTGDLGYIDRQGNLVITGRKKNIIVLSNGENISPEFIEDTLNKCPLIARTVLLGQDWKGLGALIEPDREVLEKLHPEFTGDFNEPAIQKLFKRKIREYVSPLSGFREFECIKSFRLLDKPMEIGRELTATLKIRRNVVENIYNREIEDIYKEVHGGKG